MLTYKQFATLFFTIARVYKEIYLNEYEISKKFLPNSSEYPSLNIKSRFYVLIIEF